MALTVDLYEGSPQSGGTLRATVTYASNASWSTQFLTLTPTEKASITNWSNLFVQLTSDATETEVAWIELEAPTGLLGAAEVYPISDIAAGTWTPSTGGSLFPMVDEPTTADDTDYIRSAVTPAENACVMKLATLFANTTAITMRVRHRDSP